MICFFFLVALFVCLILGNSEVARRLYDEVRVLCWIMTMPNNLQKKVIHVNATWGPRCNKILYMSDKDDPDFPAVRLNTTNGRDHLTAKSMRAFDYVSIDAIWRMLIGSSKPTMILTSSWKICAACFLRMLHSGRLFWGIISREL